MGLATCRDCLARVSTNAASCPHCGRPLQGEPGDTVLGRNRGCADLLIFGLLFLVVAVFGLIFLLPFAR